MAELPLDKVLEFLKRVRPFSELPEKTLRNVAKTLLIDYFPKGKIVLSPESADAPYLYLVFSGVARCFVNNQYEEKTIRYVSEMDHFGGDIIVTGQSTETFQVVEDMICYLIREEVFHSLEQEYDGFRHYFQLLTDTLTAQIWDWMESQESAPPVSWREKMRSSQFRTSIDTLIGREPVSCDRDTTASEIARIMTVSGVGSVIVTENGNPVGIVTKNDLTEKVLARQRGSDVTAATIMSANLVSMEHTGSCFEASLRMLENHCRHMVAMKDGALFGVISQHDLILLQGANPIAVVGAIDKQEGIEGIKKCVRDMSIVQQALIGEGGRIEDIWALMTSFRDALTRRLIVLAISDLRKEGKEPPIVEFCWITFGTPGRKETLLRKNFLEGCLYKDPDDNEKENTRSYFRELTKRVKTGLLQCNLLHDNYGMVLCSPESAWKRRIMALVQGQTALSSDYLRMFDFRGVVDQRDMIQGFRNDLFSEARKNEDFLLRMKAKNNPDSIPFCFYGDEVVSEQGRTDTVRLKKDVLVPLTDAVRALGIENNLVSYSTAGRIRDLLDLGILSAQTARDLQTAYAWLIEMSLHRALEAKQGVDWLLDPRECTSDEKRLLTDCFRLVRDFLASASSRLAMH